MTSLSDLSGTYVLDPAHSSIGFVARHAVVTKVRGSFNELEGVAVIDGSNLASSTVNVSLKTASVDTRQKDRDAHLRSGDFFDADTYPNITFASTSVKQVSDDELEVTGDLTIKDVTRPITLPLSYTGSATDPFGNQRAGFEGSVQVNRKDWGLTWNAALETGGVLVSEKVTLEFDLSTIKQA
ncbi:MAG TPA: YceI family protein [Propionibacteriaceae bacterium]|nr:YceI family protein [Propionibacteriaceae bacterium]